MSTIRTRIQVSAALLALGASLALGACDLEGFLGDIGDFDRCAVSSGQVEVAGRWQITGTGSRSSCNDERFDGDFNLSAEDLQVVQQPGTTSSQDDLALSVPLDVAGGSFDLFGTVRGSCVDFTTVEEAGAGVFRFDFDGNFDRPEIAGTFNGDGPPGCRSTGEFRIRIQ